MTRDDILSGVAELLEDVLGVARSDVTIETTPDDVAGWDSLRHLTLIAAAEERFDLVLSAEEQSEMLSVELIVDVLCDRLCPQSAERS